jgi:hypothetical protein
MRAAYHTAQATTNSDMTHTHTGIAERASARRGSNGSSLQLIVNKDCVDWAAMAPVMQRLIGPYQDEEIAKELFAMNTRLVPAAAEGGGYPVPAHHRLD